MCTDKLSQQARVDLGRFLDDESLAADIESVRELEMIETTRRLRAALELPDTLPVKKKAGGTP